MGLVECAVQNSFCLGEDIIDPRGEQGAKLVVSVHVGQCFQKARDVIRCVVRLVFGPIEVFQSCLCLCASPLSSEIRCCSAEHDVVDDNSFQVVDTTIDTTHIAQASSVSGKLEESLALNHQSQYTFCKRGLSVIQRFDQKLFPEN